MEVLSQAMHAVQRNVSALALYLVITVGASTIAFAAVGRNLPLPEECHGDYRVLALELGTDAFLFACYALAQTIVFARLGKDIDRPLWKVNGASDALQRFFPLWLGLNAIVFVMSELASAIPVFLDNENIALYSFWFLLFAAMVYIPVGAAIMFQRSVEWSRIWEDLAPLRRRYPQTLVVLFLNAILFLFYHVLVGKAESAPLLRPILDIIMAYFDCVIFSAAWYICILDRQSPEDADFDF